MGTGGAAIGVRGPAATTSKARFSHVHVVCNHAETAGMAHGALARIPPHAHCGQWAEARSGESNLTHPKRRSMGTERETLLIINCARCWHKWHRHPKNNIDWRMRLGLSPKTIVTIPCLAPSETNKLSVFASSTLKDRRPTLR